MLYTDIETLKDFLGIVWDDEDEYLESLIVQATALVDIELGDNLEKKQVTRRIDGGGTNRIIMENIVNSVSSIKEIRTNYSLALDYIDGSIVYTLQDVPRGMRNIEISYEKGYETVPDDFLRFFLEYCRELYKMKEKASTEVAKSKRIGDLSITFFSPSELNDEKFLVDLETVVRKYRNFILH